MGVSGLEDRARRLAERQHVASGGEPIPTPLERLPELSRSLRTAHASFVRTSEERGTLSGVGEWMLDNFYLIQQAIRQVAENMPPGYYRRLPRLEGPGSRGLPRVYAMAHEIRQSVEGQIDVDRVERFVRAYQEVRPLTMGEIWALPSMLRLSIIEVLAWTVAQAADVELPVSDDALPGAVRLRQRKRDEIVAGAINSLRAIESQDWEAFFEATSLVEETLRQDPADVYGAMDFDSRDRCRSAVEEMAQAVGQGEQDIAAEAVRLAQLRATSQGPGESGRFAKRAAHVGFYLIGRGREELEDAIGFEPGLAEGARRWIYNQANRVYLSSIAAIVALVVAGALMYAGASGAPVPGLAAVALLSIVPASMVGVNLVNAVITRAVPPRVLPKLDLSEGVPEEYRTMVVVPALLTSGQEVDFLLRQLEVHYLSNSHREFGFALLTDFADAPEKHMPGDEELLERAEAGIRHLNEKYGEERGSEGGVGGRRAKPFYLFHRERLWNPSEECWMGWERKRGKLGEFNRLLRGDEETSYTTKIGDLDFLPGVEYVITLDADTVLPLDAGHELVGTLAHPLNRAEFEDSRDRGRSAASSGQVVAGYTVLQPRTEVKPTAVTQTRFTRIFAGDAGLDLYTRAVSDLYQDFFGEGIYVGKGIYDVDAFERSLRGRVPENALLSHDLFEGIHGRAGLVSDVVLFEDYPAGYLSHAHRKHRWVRGDWQILPWLLPRVPGARGEMVRNRLSALDRWKILDNLRRSLRAPALFALLVAGWMGLPGSSWVWTLMAVATSALPLVTGMVTEAARRLRGGPAGMGGMRLNTEVGRWLLSLAFLPYETVLMLDAVGTTLVRLTISHKRLLQWTTSAHTTRILGRRTKIRLLWRQMGAGPVLAVLMAASLGFLRPLALVFALPLLLAWLVSPQIAAWISEPVEDDRKELTAQERRRLRRIARRTWLYFERFVGPDDHWLPPDHFQEEPRGVVARRTSPTNIGLTLVSTLCAYDLGYIGLLELVLRTSDAFDSMDELEKYRGHLLNWYDTRDLSTLRPRYVSTVDSGNLAACLIVLQHGLEDLKQERLVRWRRWRGLCDTVDVLSEVAGRVLERDEVAKEAAALRAYATDLCERTLAAREEPARWIPLLVELEGAVGAELSGRMQALLEAAGGVLDAAAVQDLRLWWERIAGHLHDLREEIDRAVPWVLVMREHPSILSDEVEADLGNTMGQRVAEHEGWQGLQETLETIPRLGQATEVCQTARRQLGELMAFLDDEIAAVDREKQPKSVQRLIEAREWGRRLDESLQDGLTAAGSLMIGLERLIGRTEAYVRDMEFRFLYDRQRDVFHIGYRVDAEELDGNHYDLLASEARIASIVAIGKGDVPQRHWLHLGRPLTRGAADASNTRTLLSWGGSMFEYLMPDLVMRNYSETLLKQANIAAVRQQIAYGKEKGVPWGVSESGYYHFDAQMNYQYRGFGVPGLGRKRGLGEDVVIASYASLLAVGLVPEEVLRNIERLAEEGMLGHYGFYEAADYTESRLPMGETRAIVRSYMAHHQGMILTALTNCLDDGAMVRRFHADPRMESIEFLLQEQVPRKAPLEEHGAEIMGVEPSGGERVALEPWSVSPDASMPQVHVLSNGRFGSLVTSTGAGYSFYAPGRRGGGERTALTRWRADTTLDCWGMWVYVHDEESGTLWSASKQPTMVNADEERVRFYPHQVEFRRRLRDISLHTEITVAAEDDVEIRRLTLTNHSDKSRRVRLSSYGEIVLASQREDKRHPAFSKLFVESEYAEEVNALLYSRRPRSAEEAPLFLAHVLMTSADIEPDRACETDRGRFIGRGRTPRGPAVFAASGDGEPFGDAAAGDWLSGTTGATLDPIMALGQGIELEPHGTARLAYLTLVGDSKEETIELARRYRAWPRIDRAFEQAHAQSEVDLRSRDLEASDLRDIQQLLSLLLYPHESLRANQETLKANERGQSALWPHGISGDYPVLLVRIADEERIPLVREALRAHSYWRDRRFMIDLVILNERDVGYAQELSDRLNQVITRMNSDMWVNRRGGIFVLRADQMDGPTRTLLETAARVVLDADEGSVADQLKGITASRSRLPALMPSGIEGEQEPALPLTRPEDLRFDNGYGGFSADGREYVVYLESGSPGEGVGGWTPAPWINVIANQAFGFLVSDTGLGYSWAENSGENRLTPWRNDPVSDVPAEALYLRDEETGEVWSPTPLPSGEDAAYLVRHGAGYSVFEHNSHGLKQQLRVFAVRDAPVKIIQMALENTWGRERRLTGTFFAEWVLGINREDAQQYVVPGYDPETTALLARNAYSAEFSERVAFLAASQEPHGLTADRTEFLGRHGDMRHPAALGRVGLESRVEAGIDPCAALQVHVGLEPGERTEFFFLLGQGEDRDEALELVRKYRDAKTVVRAWEEATAFWEGVLGTVMVDTPDEAMDLLLNRWLLYQALSSRVWGRSALYQSSGAYGFRDQLQDVMSLVHAAPEVTREHLLRAARHQFEQGDVLHWWHPPSGRGVRTRVTDDLLWLPYVTAEYVEATGDEGVLDEALPFRSGEPLGEDEDERYGRYELTEEKATLYEHCVRALDRGATSGPQGLPLIGTGDWNDGLNRVGIGGQGESVWLGWFLCAGLTRFARMCERVGDGDRAEAFRERAEELQKALERSAWDGKWYIRATYDDGTPLGSSVNEECQIASIAQSWAAMSGAAREDRVAAAMESVADRLVVEDDDSLRGLVLLFTPPFDKTPRDPGYVKGYPPGIRENGGQYTHAALWAVWAYTELGQGDRAGRLFKLLNPIYHSDSRAKADRYRVEPYVVAADVYSAEDHWGRGGWTWYTGSSGWMYRLGIEAILGLRREGEVLCVDPCIPREWAKYRMTYRYGETTYRIAVENPGGVNRGVRSVTVDGQATPDGRIALMEDGDEHRVTVQMG